MDRETLLSFIEMVQEDTSSVTLSIGRTKANGQVDHKSVVIHKAPPKVTRMLQEEGYSLEVVENGVLIR